MSDASGPDVPPAGVATERLDSWKEIAGYLRRGVSTVQRWEHEEGLPVRRHVHNKVATVYAHRSEIDHWWESRGRDLERTPAVSAAGRRRWLPWGIGAVVCLAALGTWTARVHSPRAEPAALQTVAVLPFKNATGDAALDWVGDGIADVLAARLSQHGGLSVVSSTSTARYRDAARSAREIGRELHADALVEGTVLRAGARGCVSVSLVDAATGRRLWSATYERNTGDLLALSTGVAATLAQTLGARPGRDAHHPLARAASVDPRAYEAYVHGNYFRQRRQLGGCVAAEPYLREAIALDGGFAEPHAALAFCYGFDGLGGLMPYDDALSRARQEVGRALQLDAGLADAHVADGLIAHRLEYNWAGAERSFDRALGLEATHTDALTFYGELLYASGRADRGIEMIRRALARDPFGPGHNTGLGFALYNLGQPDEAIRQLRMTVDLDPSWWTARLWLAESYALAGLQAPAMREYGVVLRQVLVPDRVALEASLLAPQQVTIGWEEFWSRELDLAEQEMRSPGSVWQAPNGRPRTATYLMARRYARLGREERALAALETAVEQRSYLVTFLNVEPLFARLRDRARFRELLRRIGLPTTPTAVAAELRAGGG